MKLKQVVLISLIVFTLGFGLVLVAGFVLPEGSRLGGPANPVPGTSSSNEPLANGTPVITPHDDGSSGSSGGSTTGGNPGTSNATNPPSSTQPSSGGGSSAPATQPSTSSSGATTPKPTTTTTTSSTTTPKPSTSSPAAPACGSPGGVCSTAQVASHSSASNCWVIYNGGYYIVTSYVNAHPGGTAVFNSSTCGKDITAYLNGSASTAGAKHRHSNSAYTTLNSYYVGKVQ